MWYCLKVQNKKETLIAKNILQTATKLRLDTLILDVGYPSNLLNSLDYQGYIFVNLIDSISKGQIDSEVIPFLRSITGVYGFVGTQVDTGTYKREIIRDNKREKINNVRVYKTDPSPIGNSNISSLKQKYEDFTVKSDNLGNEKIYRIVKRGDRSVYQPVSVIAKDENKSLVQFKNNAKMWCNNSEIVCR